MRINFMGVMLLALGHIAVSSQPAREGVTAYYNNVAVAFHTEPARADAKLLPLVDGRLNDGAKNRFGLCLGRTSMSTAAIEILKNDGGILQSITVGDLLGKGSELVELPSRQGIEPSRWAGRSCLVELPGGRAQLCIKALLTGDPSSEHHVVVTFALKSEVPETLRLRIFLPVAGNAELSG